jgi:TIR domain
MADVFISHASTDAPLADALVQLIEGGIGVSSYQIFCTSLEEQSIPPGVEFKQYIKEKLGDAKIVIALISPQYYSSAFCMCELGATWALTKSFIPLTVPPVAHDDLRGVLGGVQVLSIMDGTKLDTVYEVLGQIVEQRQKVVRWNSRKEKFLAELPAILKSLKKPAVVTRTEFNKIVAERDEYKREYEKADGEIAKLQKTFSEVSRLKDKQQVARVRRKFSSADEQFESLVDGASKVVAPLDSVVREALYQSLRGEDFYPGDNWGDDPRSAEENGLLTRDDGEFSPNSSHPKIKKALAALHALRQFVEEPPEGFDAAYEDEHEDTFDFGNRSFWQRHDLL